MTETVTATPPELIELGIIFEEPEPTSKRVPGQTVLSELEPLLARLTAYPGKSARVKMWAGASGAWNAMRHLKKASAEGKLPGTFEFTVRREHSGCARGGIVTTPDRWTEAAWERAYGDAMAWGDWQTCEDMLGERASESWFQVKEQDAIRARFNAAMTTLGESDGV